MKNVYYLYDLVLHPCTSHPYTLNTITGLELKLKSGDSVKVMCILATDTRFFEKRWCPVTWGQSTQLVFSMTHPWQPYFHQCLSLNENSLEISVREKGGTLIVKNLDVLYSKIRKLVQVSRIRKETWIHTQKGLNCWILPRAWWGGGVSMGWYCFFCFCFPPRNPVFCVCVCVCTLLVSEVDLFRSSHHRVCGPDFPLPT
jgi:hypothetical protein